MYGAILGDMIGAPYEFDRGDKTKDFPLFGRGTEFTDDTVMTIAVAEALMDAAEAGENIETEAGAEAVRGRIVRSMRKWGNKYPNAGYGCMFVRWLRAGEPRPYGSYGNGSAMRVSAAGWLYGSLEETLRYAELTAAVTHNHPEGIKGAKAVAAAIFLSRSGCSKAEIKKFIVNEFGYDLSRTCDEIRPGYHHVETCQETVPEALTAFMEGEDFEDVIRTAVSLGGDCDTLTCIAGSIAEAFYGVPDAMIKECRKRLPGEMLSVPDRFAALTEGTADAAALFSRGNVLVERAIDRFHAETTKASLTAVLDAIRDRMHSGGQFLIPVRTDKNDPERLEPLSVKTEDFGICPAAFTSFEQLALGPHSQTSINDISAALKATLSSNKDGLILNPWDKSFILSRQLVELLFAAD